MGEKDFQEMVDEILHPKKAIEVLNKILFRAAPARANGKSMTTAVVDMAIARAIVALEKESRMIHDNSVAHRNKNVPWVGNEVYDLIRNNPDGIVLESIGKDPILVHWRDIKEEKDENSQFRRIL